jgi:hypothetical protein
MYLDVNYKNNGFSENIFSYSFKLNPFCNNNYNRSKKKFFFLDQYGIVIVSYIISGIKAILQDSM